LLELFRVWFDSCCNHIGTQKTIHIAIIGGGIGGVVGCTCLHRGIFTLYERDSSFEARSQGYGLTLQQASKAIEGLGIFHKTFQQDI
jgi:2-polyprenyl-6-methoxyphenol hydroxylase-like FAD-dependent oxidoreductase